MVGPNGAGKSTLCYTIAGFVPHFFKGELTGAVLVDGSDLQSSTLNEWVLTVGLAFQNPFNQISGAKYTVFEELAFGLENIGIPRDEMIARVEESMKLTGISDLADRSPYSLSGGQQQRVALTSILVMQPKVLVLDEPTSQMDPVGNVRSIWRCTSPGGTWHDRHYGRTQSRMDRPVRRPRCGPARRPGLTGRETIRRADV